MNIYRLKPLSLTDLNWQASTWRQAAIIRAPSEETARAAATLAFGVAVERSPGARPIVNPWRQPALVECEILRNSEWSIDGPLEILMPEGHNDSLVGLDLERG